MKITTLQLILASVSTCAAAISAIAAWRAVQASYKSVEYEREIGRPYFSFERLRMERKREPSVPDSSEKGKLIPNIALAKGNLINLGKRPAINVDACVFIIGKDNSNEPIIIPKSIADDFPPNSDWMVQFGEQHITSPNHPGYYVLMGIKYDDPITLKNYRQLFFMMWPGVQNGMVIGDIVMVSQEEKNELITQHRTLLNTYL